ncbi:hypothetical protein F7R13_02500 [Burkholderia territorii]|uniref:Uncharacterized protein n=1 Tax=Burkholderia territorii TaxID=1503055 RepID=A0A6L3NN33_9BURK|nr:hypothetical protein F7R13_02500 [Burkholderia territorii]MBM2777460.1 hypothetical protein [Burkholderia territorii]
MASIERQLSFEAIEQIDPTHRPTQPDRDFKEQGAGNIVQARRAADYVGNRIQFGQRPRECAEPDVGDHHGVLLASMFALTGMSNLIPLASPTAS